MTGETVVLHDSFSKHWPGVGGSVGGSVTVFRQWGGQSGISSVLRDGFQGPVNGCSDGSDRICMTNVIC